MPTVSKDFLHDKHGQKNLSQKEEDLSKDKNTKKLPEDVPSVHKKNYGEIINILDTHKYPRLLTRRQTDFNIGVVHENTLGFEYNDKSFSSQHDQGRADTCQGNNKKTGRKLNRRRNSDFDLRPHNRLNDDITSLKYHHAVNKTELSDTPSKPAVSNSNGLQSKGPRERKHSKGNLYGKQYDESGSYIGSNGSLTRSSRSLTSRTSRGSRKHAPPQGPENNNKTENKDLDSSCSSDKSNSKFSTSHSHRSTRSLSIKSLPSSRNSSRKDFSVEELNLDHDGRARCNSISELLDNSISSVREPQFKSRSCNSSHIYREKYINNRANNVHANKRAAYYVAMYEETGVVGYTADSSHTQNKCVCCLTAFHLTIISFVILIISAALLSYTYVDQNWIKARPPTAALLGLSLFSFLTIGLAASKLDMMWIHKRRCATNKFLSKCCK